MFENLENQRFERLIAVRREGKKWLCRCDCGGKKLILASSLKRGLTKSCGCLNRELCAERNRVEKRTHGRTGTAEYKIWQGIHQRCENQNDKDFPNYGGRGIVVCNRWASFEDFFADMGRRPSKEHSIDRKDVNGNYSPDNCRWATKVEQALNTRRNIIVTAFGRTAPLSTFFVKSHSAEYQRARKAIHRGDDPEKVIACR